MAITWLLFFVLLHRFALQRGIIKPIFSDIIGFTLSIFFFSRLFHILTDWLDEKFILVELVNGNILEFLRLFFIPQDYLFSLFWAIFGFSLVFLIKTHSIKKDRPQYIDALVFAFLFASLLGYFWALLGGQVYGIPIDSPLSITYTHQDSIVKDRAPLFPLAFLYMVFSLAIIMVLRQFSSHNKSIPNGFIGSIGIGMISLMVLLGEFLSGARKDILYDIFSLSLNQIWALIGLTFAILWILRLIQKKI